MGRKLLGRGKETVEHMEKEPLISVIVPVYNVKDYLEECLDSIIKQSYGKLEIIIVDDGSTDGSADICDRYGQKDSRVVVIHQENRGVARARKRAVMRASGLYTGFVDADDQISPDMIAYMLANIGKCDVITVGCYCEEASGEFLEQTDAIEEGIYDSDGELDYFHANMLAYQNRFAYGVWPYLVNKLFRTDLLQEMLAGMDSALSYAEDAEVVFQYFLLCKGIRVTHKCLYYYRYRSTSALHAIDDNFMSNLNGIYLALKQAFEKHPKRETLLRQLQLFATHRIYWITARMGFSEDTQLPFYVFPYADLDRTSRVVLYGAGKIGVAYYRQIYLRKLAKMVLWIDNDWKKYKDSYMPVTDPRSIKDCEYDYLIIAVKRKGLADEIRQELILQGIEEEKIFWRAPVIY